MAGVHLLFLCEKFIEDLEEAEQEFNEIPLLPHFQAIRRVLLPLPHRINFSAPIRLKNPLYDLRFALAECVMLAEKEMERRSQERKSLPVNAGVLKKQWFLFWTRRKLLRIEKELLQMRDYYSNLLSPVGRRAKIRQSDEFLDFDPSRIHGFNCYLQRIEELLLGAHSTGGFRAIGIVGMGGSGKTALAQLVFHSARVQRCYSPMLWVDLSENARPKDIACSIVGDFGVSNVSSCHGWDDVFQLMYLNLFDERYMIVVDNLWHGSDDLPSSVSNFKCFYQGLPVHKGGAVIVTCRMENELRGLMGDEVDLHLIEPVLDRESCLSIVMDSVTTTYSWALDEPFFIRMKDEIVERCEGLPLAAKTLGEIVPTKLCKELSLANPGIVKKFRLIFEDRDELYFQRSCSRILNFPGIQCARFDFSRGKVIINAEGGCNLQQLEKALGEEFKVEIISVLEKD